MNEKLKPKWMKEPLRLPNRTDDADWQTILKELRYCATCWEDEARIIGNIRAKDIWRATLMVEAELESWKRKASEPAK